MPGGIIVGSARVTIVPDASSFGPQLEGQTSPSLRRLTQQITRGISDAVANGLSNGLRDAPTGPAAEQGRRTGARFADSFKAQLESALRSLPDVQINADSTDAELRIARLRTNLEQLRDQRIGVDIDSATALASLDNIRRQIEEVGRETPDVAVRIDTARALAQLDRVRAEVDELDGRRADVDVRVDTNEAESSIREVSESFAGLGGTLAALSPLAIPIGAALVGGLAGVGTVAAAAVGGIGVLAIGVSGVSDAVKLLGQRQQASAQDAAKAASASVTSAAAQAAAANQIRSAQNSLADARRAAARSEVDSAEQVRTAEVALADAVRQASSDRIAADKAVAAAESEYTRSVRAVQDAEQSLAEARRSAQRDLDNYADSQVDANLSQQQAVLDLATAQATYDATTASTTATAQQKAQAALDLAKAQQSLVEANQRLATSTEDNDTAQKAGVAGAPGVVAATKSVTDAKTAQTTAAQAVAQAETAAAEQQRKSAETVAKAQSGLSDAVRAQTRAQQDGARTIVRAQQQIAQAQQAAATAAAGAGVAGVSALDAVNDKLAKVNPATLVFAKFWRSNILPVFGAVKAAAAGGLLPGVETGLRALAPLMPVFLQVVTSLSGALGSLFAQAGKALNSPFWRQFFEYIARVAGPYLMTFGRILGNFAKGFAGLMEAFEPVTTALGAGILSLSRKFANFGAGAAGSSSFQAFIAYIQKSGPVVVDVIRNIIGIVGTIVRELAPFGLVMLKVADAVFKFIHAIPPDILGAIAFGIVAVAIAMKGLQLALLLLDANPIVLIAVAVAAVAFLVVKHWDEIKKAFVDAWNWVSDFVTTHWRLLVEIIGGPLGWVVVQVVDHWSAIKGAFQAAINWVTSTWATAWATVKAIVLTPIAVARDWIASVFGSDGAIRRAFSNIAGWVTSVWNTVWGVVRSVIISPLASARDWVAGLFGSGGTIRTAFHNIWTWVSGVFGAAWAGVEAIFMAPINLVAGAIGRIFGASGSLRAVFGGFKAAISDLWYGLEAVFKAPIKFLIVDVLNGGLIKAWDWVTDNVPGLKSAHIGNIPLPPHFATGGAVSGEGTGTSDSIWAKLSHGEHVWTAREVAAAGGHVAVQRIRAAAVGSDQAQRFATGGAVIAGAQDFIRGTDRLPYVFGASGPRAFDCSGLVSAVYNLLQGIKPYTRRAFSTSNEAGYFKPGVGTFTVGVTNNASEQHTAGELGGLKFEARDTAEGIIVGPRARDPRSFARTMYLPAADLLAGGTNIGGQLTGGGLTSVLSGIAGAGKDVAGAAGGVASAFNPATWIHYLQNKAKGPMSALQNKLGGGDVGKIIAGVPGGLLTGMINRIKAVAAEAAGTAGSAADILSGATIGSGVTGITPGDNAKTVVNVAKSLGLGKKGAEIGLITALTESSLHNYANANIPASLKYPHDRVGSDHYSAGIMQQQTGPFGNYWGSVGQVMNPSYASARFFQEMARKVPGWRGMNSGVVAQDVQVSKYPDRYQSYIPRADSLIAKYYDQGGALEPGYTLAYNGTGQRELIAPAESFNDLMALGGSKGSRQVRLDDDQIDAIARSVASRPAELWLTDRGVTKIGEVSNDHRQERRLHGDPDYR